MTAAAYWQYNYEKLPVVRVPDGQNFTADMLPAEVLSLVNRDHTEYEEEVPVIWDDATFPDKYERTLVQGKFADGYSQYGDCMPMCLVVWESDTNPFFLNVYMESATQWYDMVFMYAEAPRPGTVYIQSSDTGDEWEDIAGTEGYEPVQTEGNDELFWLLSYDYTEPEGGRPQYYRLRQILDDGTEVYSEAVILSDQLIFTGADIEGGRGGELSPSEGEDQLQEITTEPESADVSSDQEMDVRSKDSIDFKAPLNIGSALFSDDDSSAVQEEMEDTVQDGDSTEEASQQDGDPSEEASQQDGDSPEEDYSAGTDAERSDDGGGIQKMIGMAVVICVLLVSVGFFVFNRKNTK